MIVNYRLANILLGFIIYQHFLRFTSSTLPTKEFYNAKCALVNKLTNDSQIVREILPAVDDNTPVLIELALSLHQISAVDEINQAIRLTTWLRIYWNNPFLQWDPKDYGGIKRINLDSKNFWKPDLALVNQATLEEEIEMIYRRVSTNHIINYDGNVSWLAPISLFSQCKIDVSRFPFDKQQCKLIFSSWVHPGNEINLTYRDERVDLKDFITNGEWQVGNAVLKRIEKIYVASPYPFPEVHVHLNIKRRPLYYVINLLIPCSLIALLSFISFILPSDHGERVSLVITVLLANSVYMLIVSSSLPQTSDAVPVIGVYFVAIICEIALCLIATTFTVRIHEKRCEMPAWFDRLVNVHLARWFCTKSLTMQERSEDESLAVLHPERYTQEQTPLRDSEQHANGIGEGKQLSMRDIELVDAGFNPVKEGFPAAFAEPHNHNHQEVTMLSELQVLADEVRTNNTEAMLGKKWRRASLILDRFFLTIFLLVYVVLTTYLLVSM